MKSRSRNHSFLLTLVLVLNVTTLFAQQTFKYRAVLPKADSAGFYKINLQPELTAKCNADLSDIRVVNAKNSFNPYIFGSQLPYQDLESFVVFPQVKTAGNVDTATIFIAENKDQLTINQLWVRLRNTSVLRMVTLSGSDDLKNWYAIRENISLEDAAESNNGIYEQQLNFPSSTYRYLKIQISNNNREAVAVLQAGIYYKHATQQPVYVPLRIKSFNQRDTTTSSFITIRFNDAYQINKLHLAFSGSKYYKRDLLVYALNGRDRVLLDELTISSATPRDIDLSAKTNTLELEIINGDNPPLAMKSVSASQLSQSLISYFEKGEEYALLFGDAKAIAPVYDLQFFADSLQKPLPQLTHRDISINSLHKNSTPVQSSSLPNWAIWVAIAVALLVLGLLTFKMTQEVNKRTTE